MENKIKQEKADTKILTLRLPSELKRRIEKQARIQGVSINQLAGYLLNFEITQLETISNLELKLSRLNISDLKLKVKDIMANIPNKKVQEWDRIS